MFWHLYKCRVKILLHNKYLLFWLGVFPILLGTFFHMAFSEITEKSESLETIQVVVTTEENNTDAEQLTKEYEGFYSFISTMEEQGYFEVSYASYEDAMNVLSEDEADGALLLTKNENGIDMSLVFAGSGMNETILKNMINTYKYGEKVITEAAMTNPVALESVIEELYSEVSVNKEISLNAKNMDIYNQYYFALFAMTCMFGASIGLLNTEHCQADQSTVAVRRAASPTKKMAMVLSEYLAAVTIMELLFVILAAYLVLVLGVDLGNRYGLIALASFVASLLGVALGYFFGVVIKGKQSAKEGIQMAIILFLNFLAGLMVGNMKFIIEKACPVFNRINPAAIISDCFYSICAYDDLSMYVRCIISMGIWTVLLATVSIMVLRREKYANL